MKNLPANGVSLIWGNNMICKFCNEEMPEDSFCNSYEESIDFEERCLFCAMKYVEELLDETKK